MAMRIQLVCLILATIPFALKSPAAGLPSAAVKTSPTLNASPPPNAIVLLDGTNLDAWASQKNREWEQIDGPADWKTAEGGTLEVVPGAGSLITKRRFGDFKAHLEYRLLGEETNGGVFLMCRYELGIKNVAGPGPQYGCPFENLQQPIRPLVPAVTPGMNWQTLDIDFHAPRLDKSGHPVENARATVLLNGVKIHDNVELGPRKGAAKRLGDAATAPLMLQEHGTAYQFRNIWIIDQSRDHDRD